MKFVWLGALVLASVFAHTARAAPPAPVIEVFKSPSCGCCSKWVDYLKANGFEVVARDVSNPVDYKLKYGVPPELGSCHTAVVGGYFIEGHVPAAEIRRLLAEQPRARGLAVPDMPMGSPGMEGPRKDAYDVMIVHGDGSSSRYARY